MIANFAIDLLWFRYGKIGGGVSVVLNLLNGFQGLKDNFNIHLVITDDNYNFFAKYLSDKRFHILAIKGNSLNRKETVKLQNFSLATLLKENNIKICVQPDNYMPIFNRGNISYITVIHDLQAKHFPQNFSFAKRLWLNLNWKNAIKYSSKIIAISNFTKSDLMKNFKVNDDNIAVIYDPIIINDSEIADFNEIAKKLEITAKNYYYTVSTLSGSKNLCTLLNMLSSLNGRGIYKKLIVSGIKGNKETKQFIELARKKGVENNVILTGFVSDAIRNTLYKNCEAFLFPSVFEGFGMPPLEAFCLGAKVLTTKEASIPEITQNALAYVNNPYDAEEWTDLVLNLNQIKIGNIDFSRYAPINIAKQYLTVIESITKQ